MFTTDTREQHCPIRIAYARDGIEPGQQPLHASNLRDNPGTLWSPVDGHDCPIAIIRDTEHGDYMGSAIERSNYRAMLANDEIAPLLVRIVGSHNYQALAYDATLGPVPGSWLLCNALDGFENHHPVFDDDDLSQLEGEIEDGAWDDHGRRDFRKALVSLLDSLDSDYAHEIPDDNEPAPSGILDDTTGNWDGILTGLWYEGCDLYNINGGSGCSINTGCDVHFYIREWCDRATRDPVTGGPARRRQHDMRDALVKLAQESRVLDECADCGGSTAPGTPDPHQCGGV